MIWSKILHNYHQNRLYHRLCTIFRRRLFRLRLLRVFLWITVESHTLWLWNLSVSACVYCGTPWNSLRYWSITETLRIIAYSPFVFSSYFLVNRLRRRLRLLRKTCELLSILSLRSCFIFLQIDSAAACVYSGVPTNLLDFSLWVAVILLRFRLRIMRNPCKSLCILAMYSRFNFL